MSTKYQKPYVIPEGFPALLKGFTREILRAQVRANMRGDLMRILTELSACAAA